MGDNGFFRVDRRIWEHPALADRRPFSRREAWLWLISAAVWKPCRVRVGGRSIELQRGELAYSMRFLADRWGWPKSNVARFVDRLQLESMIGTDCPAQFGTATRTGVTVITICNYDKYQISSAHTGTATGTPEADQSWTSAGQQAGQQIIEERDSYETARDKNRNSNSPILGQKRDKEKGSNEVRISKEANASLDGARARRPQAERLPDDWQPSAADLAYAADRGLTGKELSDALEEFRNYWHARGGQSATKLDWSATWRNRVIHVTNSKKGYRYAQTNRWAKPDPSSLASDIAREIRERERAICARGPDDAFRRS